MYPQNNSVELKLQKFLKSGIIWVLIAIILLIIVGATTVRFGKVTGEEVGVLFNKFDGSAKVVNTGVTTYNGITHKLYILDKTIQTFDMTNERENLIDSQLRVKTIDGSDVRIGIIVQYQLDEFQPEKILESSGLGNNYKVKWIRDYVRSICRDHLGELTTEEFYDSVKRESKIMAARSEINERLKDFAIQVGSIAPKKPRFYRAYEEMIKKKKLADQAVLEEQSQAQAAKQRQQTQVVQITNIKNVRLEQFKGEMQQRLIKIKAEGEKVTKAAEAYYDKVTIGAEARLYESKKSALAILARKKAEAKGIEALKKALEGEGGLNMVKLEYAKKLKNIEISGRPYVMNGQVEKLSVSGKLKSEGGQ
jgi:hypothetical protein